MRATIVIAILVGLSITVATVVIGTRTFEGTVAKDAYTEGLQWDAVRRARKESGWRAILLRKALPENRSELLVRMLDRSGKPLQGAAVSLSLSRPETSQYDFTASAKEVGDGLFAVIVEFPRSGRWQVQVSTSLDNRTVVFDEVINVTKAR